MEETRKQSPLTTERRELTANLQHCYDIIDSTHLLLAPETNRATKGQDNQASTMVIGLLIVAGIPTTIGVCEALSAQKKANNAAKEKAKFHMTANISLDGETVEECWCILKDGKVGLVQGIPLARYGSPRCWGGGLERKRRKEQTRRMTSDGGESNPYGRTQADFEISTFSYGWIIQTTRCQATNSRGITLHTPLKRSTWGW